MIETVTTSRANICVECNKDIQHREWKIYKLSAEKTTEDEITILVISESVCAKCVIKALQNKESE